MTREKQTSETYQTTLSTCGVSGVNEWSVVPKYAGNVSEGDSGQGSAVVLREGGLREGGGRAGDE